MEILVTRHGQTDWNLAKKVQGLVNTDLNETGIEQAKATGEMLKDEKIDLIISSPLNRAMQTAEIIRGDRDIEIITDNGIIERDFGEFEGMSPLEDNIFNPDEFWSYRDNHKYEKAENIRDCFDRVYAFLDNLPKKYPDKRILLVCHGGVSIPINCYFNGIPDMDTLIHKGLSLKNAEVARYSYK